MKSIIIVSIIFILIVIIPLMTILISNKIISISRYTITSDKIPEAFNNFKILQLSDLHSKDFENNNEKLIEKIDKENPDVIFMSGDMVNLYDKNFEVLFKLIDNLSEKYTIYYILGNHEETLYDVDIDKIVNYLEERNVNVINNQKTELIKDNQKINLYGLGYNQKFYTQSGNKYGNNMEYTADVISNTLGSINKNEYNILLTHNPLLFEAYSKWGVDLVFAGHIHGGVIIIPFLGGLLSPEEKFFPKYYKGKYILNNSTMIVNAGLGNGKIPIRIFNRPDISVITLKSN